MVTCPPGWLMMTSPGTNPPGQSTTPDGPCGPVGPVAPFATFTVTVFCGAGALLALTATATSAPDPAAAASDAPMRATTLPLAIQSLTERLQAQVARVLLVLGHLLERQGRADDGG